MKCKVCTRYVSGNTIMKYFIIKSRFSYLCMLADLPRMESRRMTVYYVCSPRWIAPDRIYSDPENIVDRNACRASICKSASLSRELDQNSASCRSQLSRDPRTVTSGTSLILRTPPCQGTVATISNTTHIILIHVSITNNNSRINRKIFKCINLMLNLRFISFHSWMMRMF